jgi:hypothetical protein
LIIAGGDIHEFETIKRTFSLLNLNRNNETIKLLRNPEILYIYEQLLYRTIIFKSIIKNLSDDAEEKIG